MSSICSPLVAEERTQDSACSSSAWPFASVPIVQVAFPVLGQTVKCGAVTCLTCPSEMLTATDLPASCVLQTQTANRTQCPGWTREDVTNACTEVQSCEVGLPGFFDFVGVGVGVGVAVTVPVGFGLLLDGFGCGLLLDGFGLAELVGVEVDGLELGDDVLLLVGPGLGEAVEVCVCVLVGAGLAELVLVRVVVGFGVALTDEFVGLALGVVLVGVVLVGVALGEDEFVLVGVADGEWLTGVLLVPVPVGVGLAEPDCAGALEVAVPELIAGSEAACPDAAW